MNSEDRNSNARTHTNGIRVLGVFIIATSLLNVYSTLSISKIHTISAPVYYIAVLYCSLLFVAGVGIIKHKPWSRILALVMCSLLTIRVAVGSAKDVITISRISDDPIAIVFGVGLCSIIVVFGAWIVFYLTRPSVMAQFRKQSKTNQELSARPPNQAL